MRQSSGIGDAVAIIGLTLPINHNTLPAINLKNQALKYKPKLSWNIFGLELKHV